jgi:hypothetical protein
MSRSLLVAPLAALVAATFLLLPAAAQTPSASQTLQINGLAEKASTNQTQAALPFVVTINTGQITCVGGGSITVTLTAAAEAPKNATVQLSVQPATIHQLIGSTGADSVSEGATLLVSPGLVRQDVLVPVTVTATASTTCNVPTAGMGPAPSPAAAKTTVTFRPVSQEIANGGAGNEIVPGLELPALVGAIAVALIAARRR